MVIYLLELLVGDLGCVRDINFAYDLSYLELRRVRKPKNFVHGTLVVGHPPVKEAQLVDRSSTSLLSRLALGTL